MRDPFDVLRDAVPAVDPDPAFAARLRAHLERALALPRGVVPMTTVTTVTEPDTEITDGSPAGPRPAAVPYLAVADARAALDWYGDVFAARLVDEPIVMADGRIGHAEIAMSGGTLYLADEHPEIGVVAPRPGEASVSLMLAVDDADATRARAVAAGATGDREAYDGYGHRNAWIVDPFGHRWGLNSPLATASAGRAYRHGDVGYVSLWTPDAARATDFYADVLGWTVSREHGNQVIGATPATGLLTATTGPNLFCCFAVDDVPAAIDAVRAAGGDASEPRSESYGVVADCTDDQGTPFAIYQEPGGHAGQRPPPGSVRHGDLSYLVLEVVDSQRARDFFGAVLGWTFTPGHVADGWQVEDTVPMIGMAGGTERAAAVPMWQVEDIVRAVEAVRAGGGQATEPERQPYGVSSSCVDDQGMRFYLGQT